MNGKQKLAIAGALGVGAVVLFVILNRNGAVAGLYTPTTGLAAPASPPTYQAGNITIAPAAADAGYNPPASDLTLNFLGGESPIWGGLPALLPSNDNKSGNGLSNALGYGDGCGCGGNCQTSGATTDASGGIGAFSSLLSPFMQYLVNYLPKGTVAPAIVDPGAKSSIAAAIDVWHHNAAAMMSAENAQFSPAWNDALGNI